MIQTTNIIWKKETKIYNRNRARFYGSFIFRVSIKNNGYYVVKKLNSPVIHQLSYTETYRG